MLFLLSDCSVEETRSVQEKDCLGKFFEINMLGSETGKLASTLPGPASQGDQAIHDNYQYNVCYESLVGKYAIGIRNYNL